jgi:hypothetical protein
VNVSAFSLFGFFEVAPPFWGCFLASIPPPPPQQSQHFLSVFSLMAGSLKVF